MIKLLFISVPSDQLVIRDINLHSFDMISVAYFDKPVVDLGLSDILHGLS